MYKIISRIDNIIPITVFLSILVGIIAILLIGGGDRIKGLFGFETKKEVIAKYEEQRNTVENLLIDRNSLEDKLTKSHDINNLLDKTLIEKEETQTKISTFTDNTLTKKDSKLKNIERQHHEDQQTTNQDKTTKKTTSKEKEISKVQITSIWDTYCEFNQDYQCSNNYG